LAIWDEWHGSCISRVCTRSSPPRAFSSLCNIYHARPGRREHRYKVCNNYHKWWFIDYRYGIWGGVVYGPFVAGRTKPLLWGNANPCDLIAALSLAALVCSCRVLGEAMRVVCMGAAWETLGINRTGLKSRFWPKAELCSRLVATDKTLNL